MLFFKRILNVGRKTSGSERRVAERYTVYPQFPVTAVLNIAGRDTTGQLLQSKDGMGWDWAAKLVNLSSTGARLQLPPTVEAQRDDPCHLKLDVQGYVLTLPGRIAHLGEKRDSIVYGLVLDLADPVTQRAYDQLLDLVALGSSLNLSKPRKADESGFLFERYDGVHDSHLDIWRHEESKEVSAFEFVLKDCMVRGLDSRPGVVCRKGTNAATAKRATSAQDEEIKRLFQWVVLNLAPAVPDDVRAFLMKHAT